MVERIRSGTIRSPLENKAKYDVKATRSNATDLTRVHGTLMKAQEWTIRGRVRASRVDFTPVQDGVKGRTVIRARCNTPVLACVKTTLRASARTKFVEWVVFQT